MGASQGITWETGTRAEGKREERDMVDNHLVDYLRKGDSSTIRIMRRAQLTLVLV